MAIVAAALLAAPIPPAASQPPALPMIATPIWTKSLSQSEINQYFPEATNRVYGVESGKVVLRCRALASGELAGCLVLEETPVGCFFPESAVKAVGKYRLAPQDADGQAVAGRFVVVEVKFIMPKGMSVPRRGPPGTSCDKPVPPFSQAIPVGR